MTVTPRRINLDAGPASGFAESPELKPPRVTSLGHWPTPQEIYSALFKYDAPAVEVFDFGLIDDTLLKREAVRAAPLLALGLLDLPFERVLYRYKFIPDTASGALPPEMLTEEGLPMPQDYCTLICREGNGKWFAVDISTVPLELRRRLGLPLNDHTWEVAVAGVIGAVTDDEGEPRWSAKSNYYAQTDAVPEHLKAEARDQLLGGLADTIASLSLILNAKNVPQRVEHPPAKVNAKRERNGKPLLPRVTYIDGSRYQSAARNTDHGGTHASPVPHLRRGHRRHRYGKVFWVRDTIVNARSRTELEHRGRYVAKTEQLLKGTIE